MKRFHAKASDTHQLCRSVVPSTLSTPDAPFRRRMRSARIVNLIFGVTVGLLIANSASAACQNKFLRRTDGPRQVVTLLTGKLTFQEAQALSAAIDAKKSAPVAWIDDKGKELARQFGELKVVRPMPVGCDGKASGVVVIVSFGTLSQPVKKMIVKFDENTTVEFDESQ
jgi:hypothetical protein